MNVLASKSEIGFTNTIVDKYTRNIFFTLQMEKKHLIKRSSGPHLERITKRKMENEECRVWGVENKELVVEKLKKKERNV